MELREVTEALRGSGPAWLPGQSAPARLRLRPTPSSRAPSVTPGPALAAPVSQPSPRPGPVRIWSRSPVPLGGLEEPLCPTAPRWLVGLLPRGAAGAPHWCWSSAFPSSTSILGSERPSTSLPPQDSRPPPSSQEGDPESGRAALGRLTAACEPSYPDLGLKPAGYSRGQSSSD